MGASGVWSGSFWRDVRACSVTTPRPMLLPATLTTTRKLPAADSSGEDPRPRPGIDLSRFDRGGDVALPYGIGGTSPDDVGERGHQLGTPATAAGVFDPGGTQGGAGGGDRTPHPSPPGSP